jgi:phage terminase large subunit-like protein
MVMAMEIKDSKAYKYCQWCLEDNNDFVGTYVKKQAKGWIDIVDGNNLEAYTSQIMFDKVCGILRLMVHPDLGCSIYEGMENYHWFFVIATLCTVDRVTEGRFYETSLLEISRKNYKTFVSGIIFIIGMLLEPRFSRFFSVAPDYKLSNELKLAVKKIIKSSPILVDRFKIKRDMIECKLTEIEYVPLAYSNDGMDGKLANIYLADEAGLLDDYPVEAMRSSQITLKNKLGIIISTQYPNDNNVMLTEIDYAKKVLDGFIENKRYFSLLYEPNADIIKDWQTNNLVIYQSNPVAVDNKAIFKAICDKRTMAIMYESKRENYLCKHNNIKYTGIGTEGYVNSEQIKICKLKNPFDWTNRDVWVGVDLAETTDNCGFSMITYLEETEKVICKSWAMIPGGRIEEKSQKEKVDYKKHIDRRNCFAIGDLVIDYEFINNFISKIEEEYQVNILGVGYDIRNARASAQKWEEHGYDCIEVKQHSSVLHTSIKWLKELILNGKFHYEDNELLEINFVNCRQTEDTNLNKYLNKKKSAGKIDMVMSLVDAMYLLEQGLLSNGNFVVQTI